MNKILSENKNIKNYDKVLMLVAFVMAYLLFSHPDLWETANHSYVFLESIFNGRVFDFYTFVAEHNNTYYYINNANYNIFIYLIFGIWELPVFIINSLLHLPLNEGFIWLWAKAVPVAFYVGCGYMVNRICVKLGMSASKASTVMLFFLFNPVAFYAPMIMGQYDTLCLFFMLWAISFYLDRDMNRFSFIMGIGAVCKFFPLLAFLPMVLLVEKKWLKIIRYGLTSLWLYIPTTLLYWGKTGNAKIFTQRMIDRMFALTADTGMRSVSVFTLRYALIVFACFMYTGCVRDDEKLKYMSVYLPMVCFCLLFNSIYWHPQWLVIMMPFIVITTFMQKQGTRLFLYLDIVLAFGYFMHCFYTYPNQVGASLFDGGIMASVFSVRISGIDRRCMDYFLSLISYVYVLTPVAFTGRIFGNIIFKFRIGDSTICERLCGDSEFDKIPTKLFAYGVFVIGFGAIWFIPTLFEYINALGII